MNCFIERLLLLCIIMAAASNIYIFYCTYCPHTTSAFSEHLLHRDHHRHLNVKFNCGLNRCKSNVNCERALRLHILRQHKVKVSHLHPRSMMECNSNAFGKFVCKVSTCKMVCDSYKELIRHLNSHLHKQQAVFCPHDSCTKVYKNISSLSSHLTRSHRGRQATPVNVRPPLDVGCVESEEIGLDEIIPDSFYDFLSSTDSDDLGNDIVVSNVPVPPEDYILQNLAMFCMKLEFKFIVPEKVVQYAMEEIYKIHQQTQEFMKKELEKNMKMANIPQYQIDSIIKKSLSKDPFVKNFEAKLSSTHRRKKLFKETLPFVQPEKVEFFKRKKNAAGVFVNVKTFFYYVCVKETLKACFLDKSLNLELKKVAPRSDGVLADVTDGKLFKENKFFKENPLAIRLSLYQDGVEIVNPLGAAKTIHKVLAVYMSILNLPDYLRSHINTVKLVALCKEKSFDHDAVYGKIVKDLKDLETVGINVPGIGTVKAGLLFIAGDNAGSHALGGFLESFSKTVYFCRYCLLDRPSFVRPGGELHVFPLRTEESYNEAVEKGKKKKYGYQGVRRDSCFNELETFHVCNPGLPCCFGHDLMEGVVAYDLKLFIDYFIAEDWFSHLELNEAVDSFPYSSEDKKDKPVPVQEKSTRIKGGAWQIWTLLRLFALIILQYIVDETSDHWRALMLLTEIAEFVCSPEIHDSHLPYMQTIINDYLSLRRDLFYEELRPKHHYVSHYSFLVYYFGPLLKCWTMRFESKHTFFKRIARMIRNFKNILYSFSLKHELLQCYLRSGADVRLPTEVFGLSDFRANYDAQIMNVIKKDCQNMNDLQVCKSVKLKGTKYVVGNIVVLGQESYECNVSFGRIILILYDCEESVHFVCERVESHYDSGKRVYILASVLGYTCVRTDNLLSFYPLTSYYIGRQRYVKLKHALVRIQ